jgi:hypothetical protein
MTDLETLLTYLTLISVPIGVFYHILTLNNNRKNQEIALRAQEQALETRQAQLFMQIYQEMSSPEFYRIHTELLTMQWEDWDDYLRKYGVVNNPEAFALRNSLHYRLNGVGLLVMADLIDVDRVYDLMRTTILWQWKKWEDIIIKIREQYNVPSYLEGFEFIVNEMVNETESRGYSAEIPEIYLGNLSLEKGDI